MIFEIIRFCTFYVKNTIVSYYNHDNICYFRKIKERVYGYQSYATFFLNENYRYKLLETHILVILGTIID